MTLITGSKPIGSPMPDPEHEKISKPARFPAPTEEEVELKPVKKVPFVKIEHTKVEFMPEFERMEPKARDHTSVIAFKDCPRKYFYSIVLGFTDKNPPQFFKFGTAYHKFREVLEKTFMETDDIPTSVSAGMEAGIESFGPTDPPVTDKYGFLTRQRLMASMMYVAKLWKKEKKDGKIKVLGVEQPFEIVLADGATTRGGKADQFIKWNGMFYGRDFKTSSGSSGWYDRRIDPNDQFTGYTLGLQKLSNQPVQGLIVDVLFNTKTIAPKVQQFIASRSQWQLRQWEKEQGVVEQSITL